MLGHSRRATDVREQYRDVYLRAARREFVTSAGAEPWILSRWGEPYQSHQLAADAAERIETPFASWRSRQIPEQAVQYASGLCPSISILRHCSWASVSFAMDTPPNSEPGFPFSMLIHSRTDTKRLQRRRWSQV